MKRMDFFEMVRRFFLVASLICLVTQAAHSIEWNYFGICESDDVIFAQDGKVFVPISHGRNRDGEWKYNGTYRELADGVIQVQWKNGGNSTYTHRRLVSTKCRR